MAYRRSAQEICEDLVAGLIAHGYDDHESIERVIRDSATILSSTGLMYSQITAVIEKNLEGK